MPAILETQVLSAVAEVMEQCEDASVVTVDTMLGCFANAILLGDEIAPLLIRRASIRYAMRDVQGRKHIKRILSTVCGE